jgi:hypothetical protein
LCRHIVAEQRAELRIGFEEIRIEALAEFIRPLGDVDKRRLHEEDRVGLDKALTRIQDALYPAFPLSGASVGGPSWSAPCIWATTLSLSKIGAPSGLVMLSTLLAVLTVSPITVIWRFPESRCC